MDKSYEHQNQERDLSEEFKVIKQAAPFLVSTIKTSGEARNPKHEWADDVIAAEGGVLLKIAKAESSKITVKDASVFA